MIAGIRPIVDSIQPAGGAAPAAKPAGNDPFRAIFSDAVARVAAFQGQAESSIQSFLQGENEEIHKVALDAQRAEIAFDLFLQTRNKVVQAYQEIMRLQL